MDAALRRDLVRLRDESCDLAILLDNLHVIIVMAKHRPFLLRVLFLSIRLDLRDSTRIITEVQSAEREVRLHLAHRLTVSGRLLLRDRLIARAAIGKELAITKEAKRTEQRDDDNNESNLFPLCSLRRIRLLSSYHTQRFSNASLHRRRYLRRRLLHLRLLIRRLHWQLLWCPHCSRRIKRLHRLRLS